MVLILVLNKQKVQIRTNRTARPVGIPIPWEYEVRFRTWTCEKRPN